ncbi:four-carbon acid sugar kinase family protein [Grimontia sp. AD028]|uniref:four-carbon acid sugar kinase family protein n=1 Tax=Grimontia sp. AD028 TaxID=1581149 RepID=UPI000697EB17|nr:four-carbon acid sugar kinase family protein [Grimontia sp. AD028]
MKVRIIADDLTSAADAALPFYEKGKHCEVVLNHHQNPSAQVVSIDTNSRSLTEELAYEITKQAADNAQENELIIKTIDSTLRGHIKAEIRAAFDASRKQHLVIAPAFPDAGRITKAGIQYVNGTPVSESSYGKDPVHPALTSSIVELVPADIGNTEVLAGDASSEAVNEALTSNKVLILDADSQSALDLLVSRFPNPEKILWVGSPGLAQALAVRLESQPSEGLFPFKASRLLVVIGSANEVSHQQKAQLECTSIGLEEQNSHAHELAMLAAPSTKNADPKSVLHKLSSEAARLITHARYDGLIATGGETSRAILDRIGVTTMTLCHQLEKGFPVCHAVLPHSKAPFFIGIKAGGFGKPDSLKNAIRQFGFNDTGERHVSE